MFSQDFEGPLRIEVTSDIRTPNQIISYFHCAKCIVEKPSNVSPKDWARTQAGFTASGFQVFCTRHDLNIAQVQILEGVEENADSKTEMATR